MFRQGCGVARGVQNANDHKLALVMHVIDGIVAVAPAQTARAKARTRENAEATRKRP